MNAIPVIAIFDIGKTNKKIFLFDEQYKMVLEQSVKLNETTDEDGFPCEDIGLLSNWVTDTFEEVMALDDFVIRAVNFSAYGASFVHLDEHGKTFLPLYNYLKPYPEELQKNFYNNYGGEDAVAIETASPVLGNLNSGMQLYYLKYQRADSFKSIKWSLHLPQYISYLISKKVCSEITSIGCHTNLWSFKNNIYHVWVEKEGLQKILPPVNKSDQVISIPGTKGEVMVGIGLHDSSAALIPYLTNFNEPFILISTGTWCITLNPFNHSPLTIEDLKDDCLSYLTYNGNPVKAARIFAGNEHEQQVKRLSEYFKKPLDYYNSIQYDAVIISALTEKNYLVPDLKKEGFAGTSVFFERQLSSFETYEQAYHQLIYDIIIQQKISSQLVIKGTKVNRICVDGGFSKNSVYMYLLATAFPDMEVFAASVSQASAMGAALIIHNYWNSKPLPGNIIDLKYYSSSSMVT